MFFQGTQLQSPALSWQLITTCNFSSKGSSTLFWFLRTLYTRGAETHMHTKHPQIENKNEGEIEEKHERQRGGKTIDVIRARWHIVLCSGSGWGWGVVIFKQGAPRSDLCSKSSQCGAAEARFLEEEIRRLEAGPEKQQEVLLTQVPGQFITDKCRICESKDGMISWFRRADEHKFKWWYLGF